MIYTYMIVQLLKSNSSTPDAKKLGNFYHASIEQKLKSTRNNIEIIRVGILFLARLELGIPIFYLRFRQ